MSAEEYLKENDIENEPVYWNGHDDFITISEVMEAYANQKVKAKLEEAAERATIWVETPINGTEFDKVERDLSEKDSSIDETQYSFIEKIYVFKKSITETPLD